ncbi:MAG TPA: 16S rRNA (cytosine(1402)-N(4))-methyltransferase RsmH [Thermoanaerobaculia bacterium]|nr:16S rRNA (cytosine(1402)-N(4))-methyltransferase RsmH [Thermoanaerobaculia bacterium]
MDAHHLPVLLDETLALLDPRRGGLFVDATLGAGGHAEAILQMSDSVRLVGIDRDPHALELAARRLARFDPGGDRVRFAHANFHELADALGRLGITGGLSGVLADLGVSSMQLDTPERGFSFRFDAPLDMRMGLAERTAADLVNEASEGELEKIIRDYGEEKQARRIARSIVDARREEPIQTTGQLKRLIERVKGNRPHRPGQREGRVDPATLVFQALRIAVNEELSGLEGFIQQAIDLLDQDGRLVIISYHSLEDRIVKNALRDRARGEIDQVTGRAYAETQLIEALTRKPVRPSEDEVERNPRSRSARLRAARRI